MDPIAHIQSDFDSKFGIPFQSSQIDALKASIIFEKPYRIPEAVRGLEGFSHIWLIWEFSETKGRPFSPTVRPPRLGGNERMGVFATRSPFRPNPIGLSCVRLERIDLKDKDGPVLWISGADLMNGTPIYDIKPYIPSDCHPEATGGFTSLRPMRRLNVHFPEEILAAIPKDKREALTAVLALDPRPRYQDDAERVYGLPFAGLDIHFRVEGDELYVEDVKK